VLHAPTAAAAPHLRVTMKRSPPKKPAAEVTLQDVIVDDGHHQFSIWIDPNTNQSPAFKSATVDEPIGQVMEGRFMPMVNVRHRRHDDGPHPLKLRRVKNETNTPVLRSNTAKPQQRVLRAY
jgi:hypothetical protein